MLAGEAQTSQLDPMLFRMGLIEISRQINRSGGTDFDAGDDWGVLGENFEAERVIGTQAVLRGMRHGVKHAIHLRLYNEASGTDNPKGYLTDLRIYAAEGNIQDEALDNDRFERFEGFGVIRGLVWFNKNGKADASFAHGTYPSQNPDVQQRLEDIISVLGLPPEVINSENQHFDYDNAAMQRLIDSLPRAHLL